MTTTVRCINTPISSIGKYAVNRKTSPHCEGDFLHGWDDKYGTVCTGVGGAMLFESKDDAVRAAIEAKRLVPTVAGKPAVYDAVRLARI